MDCCNLFEHPGQGFMDIISQFIHVIMSDIMENQMFFVVSVTLEGELEINATFHNDLTNKTSTQFLVLSTAVCDQVEDINF